ncbi:dihydrofolate reductase [Tenacibaculum finnmarkense]|uniref:dipeptidyl peptidase 3 n=1 Tax=Tenacibaculum finnmarkense TaxID=2781243 RepID=UPI001E4FD127|nr:dipeptidyl peptidase 3 [Tenacibaculum finnmarkense]MCD8399032.1 dipeptidyl peptidase 3 [Tenacibaculum finnmarkense genomovar ulcerans]MCG8784510.1 dihydrofolate reductase [Tenacibaculum finnmarkense]MCG8811798.1 dihydrofolate reductase [Tenacibaculum finnmarkense]
MKIKQILCTAAAVSVLVSCGLDTKKEAKQAVSKEVNKEVSDVLKFNYEVEQFADIKVLRYQIPGFEALTLKEKKLVYYLTQAGLAGRDIMWDQNYRHNLEIRKALEHINTNFSGDKNSEDFKKFTTYLKRVWFSNGIHHHYSNDKIKPDFSKEYLADLLKQTKANLSEEALEVIFNDKDAKKVNKKAGVDNVLASAINFYGADITSKEVEAFYKTAYKGKDASKPIEAGLNSKLVRENGKLVEKVWKSCGMYGGAIDTIIFWLDKAKEVAENQKQAKALGLLMEYYKTGSLDVWDEYCIAWATSTEGNIDWINGFIEVYNDPKGYRGSYETVVQIKDFDMSKKMKVLSENAQWFEDNAPLSPAHKKQNVVGVSYKTVNVAGEAGDASPSTPIGVNLPNNNWIRQQHGSKSVSLGNIIGAYGNAGGSGRLKEFAYSKEEVALELAHGKLADKLHTALHEVIGHASGQINKGIGQPKETLKNYASTMEEGRADLVGLYYLMDPKLQELGLVSDWKKVGKAAYDGYIRNGLMAQLIRIKLGDDIEEDHMVNRQWVSAWAFEQGKKDNVIEKVIKDNKTYFVVHDYMKLREIFGRLLKEAQRIKSEGDFDAAKALVEGYGVKVDQALHKEVLERNKQFTSAPYSGFVNPVLVPITDAKGSITDVKVTQPKTFEEQMKFYAKNHSFLPVKN